MRRRILFVCNGNIFRSMTAEQALRVQFPDQFEAASAGVTANPQEMLAPVKQRLIELGADPTSHRQRKFDQDILDGVDLAVAINLDHQAHFKSTYGIDVPLFNRVCYDRDEGLLDIGEHFANWQDVPDQVHAYAIEMVDRIWESMPAFAANVDRWLPTSE